MEIITRGWHYYRSPQYTLYCCLLSPAFMHANCNHIPAGSHAWESAAVLFQRDKMTSVLRMSDCTLFKHIFRLFNHVWGKECWHIVQRSGKSGVWNHWSINTQDPVCHWQMFTATNKVFPIWCQPAGEGLDLFTYSIHISVYTVRQTSSGMHRVFGDEALRLLWDSYLNGMHAFFIFLFGLIIM